LSGESDGKWIGPLAHTRTRVRLCGKKSKSQRLSCPHLIAQVQYC
jgi:hypothetical protein